MRKEGIGRKREKGTESKRGGNWKKKRKNGEWEREIKELGEMKRSKQGERNEWT